MTWKGYELFLCFNKLLHVRCTTRFVVNICDFGCLLSGFLSTIS